MKDSITYSSSSLPLYIVEKPDSFKIKENVFIDFKSEPDFENKDIADNNKKNNLIGNLGEEIALAFLYKQFSHVNRISLEDSDVGYDILAENSLCFEIKTSVRNNYQFEITVNELRTASEKRESYYLFYISLDKVKKTAFGFIFNDPTKNFNFNINDFLKENSIFTPTRFRGELKNYIDKTDRLDLTDFFAQILIQKTDYQEIFS